MPRRDGRDATRFWRASRCPGLSLMHADLTSSRAFAPHVHEALVIVVTEAGGAQVTSGGMTVRAHPGTLLVTNPAEPHAGRVAGGGGWRFRSFYLTRHGLGALASGMGLAVAPRVGGPLIADAGLARRLLAAHRALEAEDGPESLLDALEALWRHYPAGRMPDPPVSRAVGAALGILRDRYAEDLSVPALAAQVGLSPRHLIRAFNRSVGLPPHRYLTQVRLNAACRRLLRGGAIADVAAEVGFYDQPALTHHFKRCYGITPHQFATALPPRGVPA
ncbi:MAG TPA: AraC family transcriptional regulator [Azospirillum sp.]|nr:AraC family transcriptional regulator [Azospirillum sp.]